MEKKMPLPSFSETFNMPSKILARFKDNPNFDDDDDDDDLSNKDIFPNNCSCCWATECFNSRVPSPIWNDTNFRIVSELTGLSSRIPEQCEESETGIEAIENGERVGSSEEICSMDSAEGSPSNCYKPVDMNNSRECSMSSKCCRVIKNESLCEHHSESSNNSQKCDGMPSSFPCFSETERKDCAAEVVDSGISANQHPFSGNSSDSGEVMVNSKALEPPCDESAPQTGVSEKMVSSLQRTCRREIDEIDSLNHGSNQEYKKDVSSNAERVKDDNQQTPDIEIKKGRETVEKNVAGDRLDQPASTINQFPCDNCKRIYKSKKTLSWHRNKNPDCKTFSIMMKNKSLTKPREQSITSENIRVNGKLKSNTTDLVTNEKINTHEDNLKKPLMSIDKKIQEPRDDDENSVGSQLSSVLNEKLDTGSKNSCKDFKMNVNSGETDFKNLLWQCDMCVKCYKHKSSLIKHKKKSHSLE